MDKLSATSRMPACHTTWQLFPRTVPKLLLFLPPIVNLLPIFPGKNAFPQANPRPAQHFRSPAPGPICRRPALPLTPGPEPHVPPPLAPNPEPRTPPLAPDPGAHIRAQHLCFPHAASLLGLCAAISDFFGPISPQIPRKRSTQDGDGRGDHETPVIGEVVRCRQVGVDKHKAKNCVCVLRYRRKPGPAWA